MTPTYNLPAVRIAVAEAMGFRYQEGEPVRFGGSYLERGFFKPDGNFIEWCDSLNYPDSLDACATLIETLRKEGWTWVAITEGPTNYQVQFFQPSGGVVNGKWHEAKGPLPLAICLAYLSVRGVDTEQFKL